MKSICFILLLYFPVSLIAQQSLIVKDKVTSNPLPNAEIKVTWNNPTTQKKNIQIGQTNEKGTFIFQEEYIKNDAILTIEKIGYQSITLTTYQLISKNYIVYVSPSIVNINEVVISANKFEEAKKDVPRQIETISKKEIIFSNQQTTADLLQNSGHVFIQRSQMGGGSPVLRGFEANKVLIVIDGVRMNNAIYRGGHLQNILRIDQNMLEQTEVFFGPGSLVYGSDALGGVMHFTTLQPELGKKEKALFKQNFFSRWSSANNETTAHYDLRMGFAKWAFVTSINASSFGDLRQGSNRNAAMGNLGLRDSMVVRTLNQDNIVRTADANTQSPSAYGQIDLLQKIRFAQSEKIDHVLNLQFSNTTNVPRYDRLTDINPTTQRLNSSEWYYGPELRSLVSYQLKLYGTTKLYNQARVITSYQYIEESRHDRTFRSANLTNRNEFVHVYSLNADFTKQLLKQEIRYGVEYTLNTVASNANRLNINNGTVTSQFTRYPDGGSQMQTAAAYVSHAWEISPKFILSDGLRISSVNLKANFIDKTFFSFLPNSIEQRNTAINGQLGLAYLPSSSWKINMALSSGFRAPNIDDLAKTFDSRVANRLAILPNPNLKPEYAYTAEASISKIIAKRLKFEVTGYYTWVENLITTRFVQINGNDSVLFNGINARATQSQNAQQAFIYGTSATLKADINQYIIVSNTFNYTYGRIQTDSTPYPLDHIPPVFGRSAIHVLFTKIQGEFFVLYNGWKRIKDFNMIGEDNPQYATAQGMPSWITLNMRLSYNIPIASKTTIQLQLGCENLLDRNYRTFASGISAPGRNVYTTLRFSF